MNNEPVAWMEADVLPLTHIIKAVVRREQDEQYTIPLYTHPAKTLTDEEIDKIENAIYCKTIQKGKTQHEYIKAFAKAILRKAQEK